jgi:hypothetical protein
VALSSRAYCALRRSASLSLWYMSYGVCVGTISRLKTPEHVGAIELDALNAERQIHHRGASVLVVLPIAHRRI